MIAACVTDDCDGTGCACDCHDPQDTDRKEPRMAGIFEDLEHEWHAAEDWFARHARHDTTTSPHGDTITAGPPPATGAPMSLETIVDKIETRAKEGEAALVAILQEHLPEAATLAALIKSNPIFTSVEGALHVPQPILNGVAKMLDDIAVAYPKPGDTPAAAVTSDPQPVAEPQTAEQVN